MRRTITDDSRRFLDVDGSSSTTGQRIQFVQNFLPSHPGE